MIVCFFCLTSLQRKLRFAFNGLLVSKKLQIMKFIEVPFVKCRKMPTVNLFLYGAPEYALEFVVPRQV